MVPGGTSGRRVAVVSGHLRTLPIGARVTRHEGKRAVPPQICAACSHKADEHAAGKESPEFNELDGRPLNAAAKALVLVATGRVRRDESLRAAASGSSSRAGPAAGVLSRDAALDLVRSRCYIAVYPSCCGRSALRSA